MYVSRILDGTKEEKQVHFNADGSTSHERGRIHVSYTLDNDFQ